MTPRKDRLRRIANFLKGDRIIVGGAGFGLLLVGCVAIFAGGSEIPSTAAIIAGSVMLSLGVLVDRILLIKYGPYEVHLANDYLDAADVAEEEGADEAAQVLRQKGFDVLEQADKARLPYMTAIRQLYNAVRGAMRETARQALAEEDLTVQEGLNTLISGLSLVGSNGDVNVGVLISVNTWDPSRGTLGLARALHAQPGLRGVVVIQQDSSWRRRGLPEPSLDDVEASVENAFEGKLRVRLVNWKQGDSTEAIRSAVTSILS